MTPLSASDRALGTWRWQGVPFYVRTGKRLARRASAVSLQFRQPPQALLLDASAAQVPAYDAGSWGTRQADHLFDCDWRKWRDL